MRNIFISLSILILVLAISCKKKDDSDLKKFDSAELLPIVPDSGKIGDTIVLKGKKLRQKSYVYINGESSGSENRLKVIYWSGDTILKIHNDHVYKGDLYSITINNSHESGNRSNKVYYKIFYPKLEIVKLNITVQRIGRDVKVSTNGFFDDDLITVEFVSADKAFPAKISSKSLHKIDDAHLNITIPDIELGSYYLKLTNRGQFVISKEAIKVDYRLLTLAKDYPRANAGSNLILNGHGFNTNSHGNKVTLIASDDSLIFTPVYATDSTLTVALPEEIEPVGYYVVIEANNQIAKSYPEGVMVSQNPLAPLVDYPSIKQIQQGQTWTLTGQRLSGKGDSNVKFTLEDDKSIFTVVKGNPNFDGTSLSVTIPYLPPYKNYSVSVEVDGKYGHTGRYLWIQKAFPN